MTPPLRIGVDARELLGHPTGVGRYLGELLRRWLARADSANRRFLLYSPERLVLALPDRDVEQRVGGRGRGTWWEQTWLGRAIAADRPDVFFAPAYTAPLRLAVPFAVTIHDISFVAHPEWFRPREGMRRRFLTARAAARAAVVFTDSEFSRGEIEQRLAVPRSRIQVVAPGIKGPVPRRGKGPVPRRDPGGTGPLDPLVLFVGSIFNRRRLPDLIAAFARATSDLPDARLVIAGEDRTWPPQNLGAVAEARGVASRVEFRSYVDEATLSELYARAAVFVFLSEYEGFGLTPLEALSAGVPVVVLDTPVAREVCGAAAEYVQRDDIAGTAAAIRRFLTIPDAARALLSRAPAVLARYSWDRSASATLEHLERISPR